MKNDIPTCASIVMRDPAELRPADYNPRKISEDERRHIVASIETFGLVDPLIVNKHPDRMDVIVGGHRRNEIALELQVPQVPTVEVSLELEAERELNVRLNKNTGAWDFDLLKANFDLEDLVLWGFDRDELDLELGGSGESGSGNTDPDQVPDPPADPKSVPGEIYQLGEHLLICGDSTDPEVLARVCPDPARLWITDPPYNVDYVGKTQDALQIKNDSMPDEQFRQFLHDAYAAADSVMQPGAAFYIFHAMTESYNFHGAARDVGLELRQAMVWVKNSFVVGRQDYHWQHEALMYGWKSGAAHYWASDRKQSTVIEWDRPQASAEHPTMKPVGLFEYLITNNTSAGDVVLDSFGGSGTTLLACENLKRKARLVELDPVYCDVIIQRWEDYTGEKVPGRE